MAGTALLTAAAYQVPFAYRIDVGGADSPYVADFNAPQRFRQTTWRWTLEDSRLVFHNAGQALSAGRLRLRFAAPRPAGVAAPTLVLSANGHALARVTAPAELVEGVWPLTPEEMGYGDLVLRLQSETFSKGDRRLGVQIDEAALEGGAGFQRPPLRTSLLVLAIVLFLLAWPGARGDRHAPAVAGALAVTAALAVVRETAVAVLPPLATAVGVVTLAAHARRGQWRGRLESAVDRRRLRHLALGAGVALAVAAEVAIALCGPGYATVALLLVGAGAVGLLAPPVVMRPPARTTAGKEMLVAAALLGVALALRLHALGSVPFSLFRDEARHGLIALDILRDPAYRPVFVPPPVSQPAAYMYLLAWVFRHWGASLFSLRVVSAVAGAAAIPGLYVLVRPLFGSRVAAMAAFGLAASSWHVTISRFAMPYALPTLLALPAYLLLHRALGGGGLVPFAGAGLAIGLAQYGSQTSRVLMIVAAAMVVDAFVRCARGDPAARRGLVIGALVMASTVTAVASPLLLAAASDPDAFLSRTREVALWNGETGEGDYLGNLLLRNVFRYAGAFNVRGDWNGRHNLPGAPLLDPISGVLALLGAVGVAGALRDPRARFVAFWLVAGLVPGLLSGDAPSALRTVEAAPAVYTIVALGAGRLTGRSWLVAVAAGAIVLFNAWTYFGRAYESPAVWRRGGAIGTHLGETLRGLEASGELPPGTPLFVPTAFLENPDDGDVLAFLTDRAVPVGVYDRGPMPTAGAAAILVPNYADLWRLVAAREPRYAPEVDRARAAAAQWRRWLGPVAGEKSITGAPFPGTDRPTFWLFLRR